MGETLGVDLRGYWTIYRPVFAWWAVPAWAVTSLLFVRLRTRLGWGRGLAATGLMIGGTWVTTLVMLLPLLVWLPIAVIAGELIGRDSFDRVWMVGAVAMVGICVGVGIASLRLFGHKATWREAAELALLHAACVWLATYRMYLFAIAHPPEA